MVRTQGPYIAAPYPRSGKAADFPLPLLPGNSVPGWGAYVGDMTHVLHPGRVLRFRAICLPNAYSGGPATVCHAEFKVGAVGAAERSGSFMFDFDQGRLDVIAGNGYGPLEGD